ncbi:MAG: DNA-directed RNA polymerase subunit alpha [Phycisphaerae bacterium]|nr:DNA-directed RNA polymerase subunit alpha [Phycisphaerae bacterium]
MRIRWRGLELPTKLQLDREISNETFGRLDIEPFERGFGTTVGNSLRRILLSSLEGAAVTSIKLKGANHEFMSIKGVLEDVTDIVLNIKSLVVKFDGDEPRKMRLTRNTAGVIKASDIEAELGITIIEPEHVIATLTDDIEFDMELTVERGRGYVTATEKIGPNQEVGIIPVDAIFSPVRRVRYKIEDTRVGQVINYDRLVMEIWTDGTVSPEMALVEASKILSKHLTPFIQYFEMGDSFAEETAEEIPEEISAADEEQKRLMEMPTSELQLSVRAANCLEMAKIDTLGQLLEYDENQLLSLRSFGKTSLREVRRKLEDLGISLKSDK